MAIFTEAEIRAAENRQNLEELLNSTGEVSNQPLKKSDDYIGFRPFAATAEKKQAKIDDLEKKAAALTDKIQKGKAKIEKWNAKMKDAQGTIEYCTGLINTHSLSKPVQAFMQNMINRQKNKIERCRNKISEKQAAIQKSTTKRSRYEQKIKKQKAKIDKLFKLDEFITNLLSSRGRRENFLQAVTDMRTASLDRNTKKLITLENKISSREYALAQATTETAKVNIRQQIRNLESRKSKIEEKVQKLEEMTEKLNALSILPKPRAEDVMTTAAEGIQTVLEHSDDLSPAMVEETVVNETGKAISNDLIDQRNMNKEQAVIEKLSAEINDDMVFFGEITFKTDQHIRQAGYEYENGSLTKKQSVQEAIDKEVNNDTAEQKVDETVATRQDNTVNQEANAPVFPASEMPTPSESVSSAIKPASNQSDYVKLSSLSGSHIQALKDAKVQFWVKQDSDTSFSAFIKRSNLEQTKNILTSLHPQKAMTTATLKR